MSARRRNLLPLEKVRLPAGRQLPEIIHEQSVYLPETPFGEEVYSNFSHKSGYIKEPRHSLSSNVSSATSQRFSNMFYRTENWPSLSDTGTDSPDYVDLESSDSSASSMFSWADNEGTRLVAEQWEKIQRTLYDEDGPKVTQSHLIEECNQWKTIFPHIRVLGKSCGISSPGNNTYYDTEEEVIAMQCDSDNEISKAFLLIEEYSQKPDCQNHIPLRSNTKSLNERERGLAKISTNKRNDFSLVEELDSYLHITPIGNTIFGESALTNTSSTSSIIKSEISSSRWRHRTSNSPDFVSLPYHPVTNSYKQISLNTRDNSAGSVYSSVSRRNITDTESSIARLRCSGNQNIMSPLKNHLRKVDKHLNILEPIGSSVSRNMPNKLIQSNEANPKSGKNRGRHISLPPIVPDENKNRFKNPSENSISSGSWRKNQHTLTPIDMTSDVFSKNINGYLEDFSSSENNQVLKKATRKKKRRNSKKKILT